MRLRGGCNHGDVKQIKDFASNTGDGKTSGNNDGEFEVEFLEEMFFLDYDDHVEAVIRETYKNWKQNLWDPTYFQDIAILAPTHEEKDPLPQPSQYNVEVYDFLCTHTASFQKFLEPFLCWDGISRYYEFDENSYLSFLDENDEGEKFFVTCFVFSFRSVSNFCCVFLSCIYGSFFFIRHVDPTNVRVGEIEMVGDQVFLLEATRGRVVSLGPAVFATVVSSEGNMTESINRLFDEGNSPGGDNVSQGGDDAVATNHAGQSGTVVEIERIDIKVDAETLALVADKPKKVRKGKTVGASDSNHPSKKLRADHGISAGVSDGTGRKSIAVIQELFGQKCEGGGPVDSVTQDNLRTHKPTKRFVISSDSNTNAADHKVTYVATFVVPNLAVWMLRGPPILLVMTSLPRAFILVDQLDPHVFFSQLRAMEYDQLFTEFNVGALANRVAKDSEVFKLTQELLSLYLLCDDLSIKASTLECEKDKLVDQGSELKAACSSLRDEVAGYELFKQQVEAGGLAAGIDHGKGGTNLDELVAYDPSVEAHYVSAINALCVVVFPFLCNWCHTPSMSEDARYKIIHITIYNKI
nr:ATP-dependent DNA helicase PIF1 [Tanacetum cinerariifolium]